jgi:excisionase family DNA binding protein
MSDSTKLDNARELAHFLNVSVAAVRKWIRLNTIPVLRLGRSCRYDRAAVLLALQDYRQRGARDAN